MQRKHRNNPKAELRELQRELAILKRRNGATFRAIAKAAGISKSTAYRWACDVEFALPRPTFSYELVPRKDWMECGIRIVHAPIQTPDRHKRGGRRRPQHIEDDYVVRWLQWEVARRMRELHKPEGTG